MKKINLQQNVLGQFNPYQEIIIVTQDVPRIIILICYLTRLFCHLYNKEAQYIPIQTKR